MPNIKFTIYIRKNRIFFKVSIIKKNLRIRIFRGCLIFNIEFLNAFFSVSKFIPHAVFNNLIFAKFLSNKFC